MQELNNDDDISLSSAPIDYIATSGTVTEVPFSQASTVTMYEVLSSTEYTQVSLVPPTGNAVK